MLTPDTVAVHARDDSGVNPGDWIMLFDGAAEVAGVGDHPGFPAARMVILRPATGPEIAALVPLNYVPIRIDWAQSRPTGSALKLPPLGGR